MKHLQERNGIIRYRRAVPADLRKIIGKREWSFTFDASTPQDQMERRAARMAEEHDRLIRRLRNKNYKANIEDTAKGILDMPNAERYGFLKLLVDVPEDWLSPEARDLITAVESGGKLPDKNMSLSAIYEEDKLKHGQDRDEKIIRIAVESFIAFMGDVDITIIRYSDVENWLLSLEVSPATKRRRLGPLRAIVNRAYQRHDIARTNPFVGHEIKDSAGGTSDRLPLNKAMLGKLRHWLDTSNAGFETKLILRLMLGTGAGPGEIGGITRSDIVVDRNIPFVYIRPNAVRRLKAKVRERRVPLVGDALDAAKEALQRAREAPDAQVFPGYRPDRGADSISVKLTKALRSAGIPKSKRLTPYSLRHNWAEALRDSGCPTWMRHKLLGHSSTEGIPDRYGSPSKSLPEKLKWMKKALPRLGKVENSIYNPHELLE